MKLFASFKSLLSRALAKNLKPRTKRLFMLASLGARMVQKTEFDRGSMSKLNTVMALSHRDDALTLPILMSKLIWKGRRGTEVLYDADTATIQEAPAKLLDAVPQWLRYDETEMKCDLQCLLENRQVLPS